MKFTKSIVLAAAVAACSLCIVDATYDCAKDANRLPPPAATPAVVPTAPEHCGACLDDTFFATGDDQPCSKRTKSCNLADEFMSKSADTCNARTDYTATGATFTGSKKCPANAHADKFEDKCECNEGYSQHTVATGSTPAVGLVCSEDKTNAICAKADKNSKMKSKEECECKILHELKDGKCVPIALDKLTEADCKLANRKFADKKCGECLDGFATDANAPHLRCYKQDAPTETDCKKVATRAFDSKTKLCKCKAGQVPTDHNDDEYSGSSACVEGSGAITSMIISSSVVIVSVIGSLMYLL